MKYSTAKEVNGKMVHLGFGHRIVRVVAAISVVILLIGAAAAYAAPPMEEDFCVMLKSGSWICGGIRR